MPTSEHFPENWPEWEIDPSTRTSVHVWNKYVPIDTTVGTSAVDLLTVSRGEPAVNLIKNPSIDELHFILDIEHDWGGRNLVVRAVRTRRLKNGAWGKEYPKRTGSSSTAAYLTKKDHEILDLLEMMQESMSYSLNYKLNHVLTPYILEQIIGINRLHWQGLENAEITSGEPCHGILDWQLNKGKLEVSIVDHADRVLLPVTPLMYCDTKTNSIGMLTTVLSDEQEKALSTAPAIPAEQSPAVKKQLEQLFPKSNIALPEVTIRKINSTIAPVPILKLFALEEHVYYLGTIEYEDYADLHYDYDGILVAPHDPTTVLSRTKDGEIEKIQRTHINTRVFYWHFCPRRKLPRTRKKSR